MKCSVCGEEGHNARGHGKKAGTTEAPPPKSKHSPTAATWVLPDDIREAVIERVCQKILERMNLTT